MYIFWIRLLLLSLDYSIISFGQFHYYSYIDSTILVIEMTVYCLILVFQHNVLCLFLSFYLLSPD